MMVVMLYSLEPWGVQRVCVCRRAFMGGRVCVGEPVGGWLGLTARRLLC